MKHDRDGQISVRCVSGFLNSPSYNMNKELLSFKELISNTVITKLNVSSTRSKIVDRQHDPFQNAIKSFACSAIICNNTDV